MFLKNEERDYKIGLVLGFILTITVFAACFFVLLYMFGKLPANWTFFHILGILLLISTLGWWLRRMLK